MKIVFPTQVESGFDSPVHNHFGSAKFFVVADTENDECQTFVNPDQFHLHGQCQPTKALEGTDAEGVVVGGIGGGALKKLHNNGIRVFRAVEGTVQENLLLLRANKLPEFDPQTVCAGHDHSGRCSHG